MTVIYLLLAGWALALVAFVAGWVSHAGITRAARRTYDVDFTRRRLGQ